MPQCFRPLSGTDHHVIPSAIPPSHVLVSNAFDCVALQVLHGADSDVEWLQKDFGLYLVNMFDTHQAARLLNLGRHSLDHLLKLYCHVEADKRYQLADWRIR